MKIHNFEMLKEFYKGDKLNVAIVTDIFFPTHGGVSFVVDNLAKAFLKSGKVNVAVFTGKVKGYTDTAPYPVIRVNSFPIPKAWGDSLPLPKLDCKLKKLIKELDIICPDIIHLHNIHGHNVHLGILFSYFKSKKDLIC